MKRIDYKLLRKLSTTFSVKHEFASEDTRFLEIVIDVLHTGQNTKGSYFSKEAIERAIPTLLNTPILAFVDNANGEVDFKGHEHKLAVTAKGIEDKYMCAGYGVIPESSTICWVEKECDDGVTREFLQATALLWTKFDDVMEIFERDGEKAQSMELELDSIKGSIDKDGAFHYEEFKFFGCCLLGENVSPAMVSSVAVANFTTQEDVATDIKAKLYEYFACQKKAEGGTASGVADEGGKTLEKDKKDVPLDEAKAPATQEFAEDAAAKADDGGAESTRQEDGVAAPPSCEAGETASEFALEGQFKDELLASLRSEKVETDWGLWPKYSFVDYDKEAGQVYCFDSEDGTLYGFAYTAKGDSIAVDFATKARKKFAIVDFAGGDDPAIALFTGIMDAQKGMYEEKLGDFAALKDEHAALVEKVKAEEFAKETAVKHEVLERFEKELGDVDGFADLKEKMADFTADDLETQCFALVGMKKASFSKAKAKEQAPKLPVLEAVGRDKPGVPYAHYFE